MLPRAQFDVLVLNHLKSNYTGEAKAAAFKTEYGYDLSVPDTWAQFKEADRIEGLWRDLLFATHATSGGAITSLALAEIDTALWDWDAIGKTTLISETVSENSTGA